MPDDLAQLETHGFAPFDLVCVNLYPFQRTMGRLDVAWEEAIEQIDIGGPALLRAAAKNHAHVVPLCRPTDYEPVVEEYRLNADVSPGTRRALAARAFQATASLDGAVAGWLGRDEVLPETFVPVFDRVLELAYGENPHQRAAYYEQRGARTHVLARVEQLQGKALSFNNIADLSAARLLLLELEGPAAVIVKHANPCGVAKAATIEEAYAMARAADPVSAYGGVVALNRDVSDELASALADQFVEVLHAPAFSDGALAQLAPRETTRVLVDNERRAFVTSERDLRRVLGGLLVQDRDSDGDPLDAMDVVCGDPDAATWEELLFAWTVVKHVDSNAIVLTRSNQTIGIGAGQMSRVDAVRLAVGKAREPRSRARGRGARLRRVLPVRRRAAAGDRRGDRRCHPAGRLEARRRGDRRPSRRRRHDGAHGPAALPALIFVRQADSAGAESGGLIPAFGGADP